MAKKSRRLPGGRVRKSGSSTRRPDSEKGAAPAGRATGELSPGEASLLRSGTPLPSGATAVPGVTGSALGRGEGATERVIRPQGPLLRRRGAVTPRTASGGSGQPGGTRGVSSTMDAVAAGYTHIRSDLARILILALVMLAVIVGLSFVLR